MEPALRLASARDARQIVALVRECYAGTYADPAGLDVAELEGRLARGETIYALAEAEGRLVGQVALERRAHGLYVHCRAVVAEGWRGRRLLERLSEPLLGPVARELGAQLILGHSITQHTFTQRFNVRAGFVPLGLLLGVYPGSRPSGIEAPREAASVVLMGLPLAAAWEPRFPQLGASPLGERIREIYRALGVPTRSPGHARGARLGLEVLRSGPRTHLRLRAQRGERPSLAPLAAASEAELAWVDVPVAAREATAWLERLEDLGFVFGALVPLAGAEGEDVLRMQRCLRPCTRAGIRVLDELRPLRESTLAATRRAAARTNVSV